MSLHPPSATHHIFFEPYLCSLSSTIDKSDCTDTPHPETSYTLPQTISLHWPHPLTQTSICPAYCRDSYLVSVWLLLWYEFVQPHIYLSWWAVLLDWCEHPIEMDPEILPFWSNNMLLYLYSYSAYWRRCCSRVMLNYNYAYRPYCSIRKLMWLIVALSELLLRRIKTNSFQDLVLGHSWSIWWLDLFVRISSIFILAWHRWMGSLLIYFIKTSLLEWIFKFVGSYFIVVVSFFDFGEFHEGLFIGFFGCWPFEIENSILLIF